MGEGEDRWLGQGVFWSAEKGERHGEIRDRGRERKKALIDPLLEKKGSKMVVQLSPCRTLCGKGSSWNPEGFTWKPKGFY